jgi:hypothetical protein
VAERSRAAASLAAPHAVHDPLLVAALVAGDATDADRADALVAGCSDCAALAADLRAISLAATTLPPRARSRDFRLTTADAERLRPRGVKGLVAAVRRLRIPRAQPVAAGLTMLGLTGLLVTSLSLGDGAPTTATVPADSGTGGAQLYQAPGAGVPGDIEIQGVQQTPTDRDGGKPFDTATPAGATPAAPRLAIAVGSAIAAFAGIGLFLVARRRTRIR